MTADGRESILMIRLSAIGDCVMNSAAARALRLARPEAFIAWIVEPKSAPVVVGNPYCDETIVWNRTSHSCTSVGAFRDLQHQLRPYGFDVALDFQGLLRSALIGLASGARIRAGFTDGREASALAANRPYTDSATDTYRGWAVRKYVNLLAAIGIDSDECICTVPVLPAARAEAEEAMRALGVAGGGLLGLHLRGSWPNKMWPLDSFARVAAWAYEEWGLTAAILGGPDDRADAERLNALLRTPAADFCGRTSLATSIALLERCAAVIGPDTGTIHAAAALGRPTVALFGPTPPEAVAPRGGHVRVVFHRFPCHPCLRRPTCRHYDCMLDVSAGEVFRALSEVIRAQGESSGLRSGA